MNSANHSLFEHPVQAPYPGLRPFQPHESAIFFGRGEHVADMLTVLENRRFLAVMGPSGGGKSSLVLAGLIPALKNNELLTAHSDDWRFITLRPGDSPYANLAGKCQQYLCAERPFHDDQAGFTELVLRRSPFGLLDVLRDAAIPEKANVLVLVDQFEELFRFRALDMSAGLAAAERRDDAAAFVQLLLETAKQTQRPVHVMLTMRSDFLGECDLFDGLPQAINQSQYLTPRLSLAQLKDAITGPVNVPPFHGAVFPEVVQGILNDVGTGRDELPLVQHALFRTWQKAREQATDARVELTLKEYEAIGGLKGALSRHADEALAEFPCRGPRGRLVEKVFRGLSTRGPTGQRVRRPATIEQLAEETGCSVEDVRAVVEAFRREDRSFLMPAPGQELTESSKVDISHESLIRQWHVLRDGWLPREDESAQRFKHLAYRFSRYQAGKGDLLPEKEAKEMRRWWAAEQPTAAWARRYDEAQAVRGRRMRGEDQSATFTAISEFVEKSFVVAKQRALQERRRQKQELAQSKRNARMYRMFGIVVSCVALVAIGLGIFAWVAWARASGSERQAKEFAERADYEAYRARVREVEASEAREKAENAAKSEMEARNRADKLAADLDAALRARAENPDFGKPIAQRTIEAPAPEEMGTVPTAADRWPNGTTLYFRFLSGTPQKQEIVQRYANEWTKFANLQFDFLPGDSSAADALPIGLDGARGDWAYLGKQAIRSRGTKDSPAINLGSVASGDNDYTRGAVLREFGHLLGLISEHQSPKAHIPWNRERVYLYFNRSFGMSQEVVDFNVLKKYHDGPYRDFDPDSVMMFSIPAELTEDGKGFKQNTALSRSDKQFIGELYPFQSRHDLSIGGGSVSVILLRLKLERFFFMADEAGTYQIRVEGPSGAECSLFGPDNEVDQVAEITTSSDIRDVAKELTAGLYCLKVRYFDGQDQQSYQISVQK